MRQTICRLIRLVNRNTPVTLALPQPRRLYPHAYCINCQKYSRVRFLAEISDCFLSACLTLALNYQKPQKGFFRGSGLLIIDASWVLVLMLNTAQMERFCWTCDRVSSSLLCRPCPNFCLQSASLTQIQYFSLASQTIPCISHVPLK